MTMWASKELINGEIVWERDIWAASELMDSWMWLAAYEKGAIWDEEGVL